MRRVVPVLWILGVLHAVPASAHEQLVQLDIWDPKLLCQATDTYCKVALKLIHAFPKEMIGDLERIPVRCVARLNARKEGQVREQPMTFVRVRDVPLLNAAIEGGFEVGFDFPPGASSVHLDGVTCTALIRS